MLQVKCRSLLLPYGEKLSLLSIWDASPSYPYPAIFSSFAESLPPPLYFLRVGVRHYVLGHQASRDKDENWRKQST